MYESYGTISSNDNVVAHFYKYMLYFIYVISLLFDIYFYIDLSFLLEYTMLWLTSTKSVWSKGKHIRKILCMLAKV